MESVGRERIHGQLSPHLAALDDRSRSLWADEVALRRSIEDIVVGYDLRRGDLDQRIAVVDTAVREALAAVGLPRGQVDAILVRRGVRANGAKLPNCTLEVSLDYLRAMIGTYHDPASALKTWVHESMHARRPFSDDWHAEWTPFPGYEEGMADGLARTMFALHSPLRPSVHSYEWYVGAYRSLAAALDVAPDLLWRALWAAPLGRVRTQFGIVLSRFETLVPGVSLSQRRITALSETADFLFARDFLEDAGDPMACDALWREALK